MEREKKNLRHYKILHPSFKKEKINSCASIHEYFFQRFAPTFFHENRKAMLTNIHSYANDITWEDEEFEGKGIRLSRSRGR